jgi:thiol-disulfide isomerase/thioredoxin
MKIFQFVRVSRGVVSAALIGFCCAMAGCSKPEDSAGKNPGDARRAAADRDAAASAPAEVPTLDLALPGPAKTNEADIAWDALVKSAEPGTPPDEWRTQRPSEAEIAKFRDGEARRMVTTAESAKSFYTKFPKHDQAGEAKEMEYELLRAALRLGQTSQLARVEAIEVEMLKDAALPEEQRFKLRFRAVERAATALEGKGNDVMLAEYEKGVRALQKEFPRRQETFGMLFEIASNSSGDRAKKLAEEIVAGTTDEELKEQAAALLKKLGLIGKPLAIKFDAVDKRAVDLGKMQGKVVLVDFWATWCGPCVKEIPNVRAAYEKLSAKGFEIVGISFDQQLDALQRFVEKEKMPWPQYFDGKGWENNFGREFGITGIPAMWLVDKKGNLRDMNAREDLVAKVEKLLAE